MGHGARRGRQAVFEPQPRLRARLRLASRTRGRQVGADGQEVTRAGRWLGHFWNGRRFSMTGPNLGTKPGFGSVAYRGYGAGFFALLRRGAFANTYPFGTLIAFGPTRVRAWRQPRCRPRGPRLRRQRSSPNLGPYRLRRGRLSTERVPRQQGG